MSVTTSSVGGGVGEGPENGHGRLVTCPLEDLRLHPSYIRHSIAVDAEKLSAIARLGALAFREPLAITQDRIILDGIARWTVARMQGRPTIQCIEYQKSETEALENLLQRNRQSASLNAFVRIRLALDLELDLKTRARARQQTGGLNKGSSILTEADRLDVRQELARIAVVSVGNVTKVKQLIPKAHPNVISALTDKEISIHCAWSWRLLSPSEQIDKLLERQSSKYVRRTIRQMVLQHQSGKSDPLLNVNDLAELVSAIRSGKLGAVKVVPIKGVGNYVFVGEGLLRVHKAKGELIL